MTDFRTELLVCTTCRTADAPRDAPPAGQALFEQLQARLGDTPAPLLRGIACLAACPRACSVALQAPGKNCYVFGELTPDADSVQAVLAIAHQHAESPEGVLAWAQRPERLRRGLIARLPPPSGTAEG
jgi:predicted metal-binding protein